MKISMVTAALCCGLRILTAHAVEVDVEIAGLSKHSEHGYNGVNPGIGARVAWQSVAVEAGEYKNSYWQRTDYFVGEWLPLHASAVRAGVFGGVASAYTRRQDRIAPLVGGFDARWQQGLIGVAIKAVPPAGRGTAGCVMAQVVFRVR